LILNDNRTFRIILLDPLLDPLLGFQASGDDAGVLAPSRAHDFAATLGICFAYKMQCEGEHHSAISGHVRFCLCHVVVLDTNRSLGLTVAQYAAQCQLCGRSGRSDCLWFGNPIKAGIHEACRWAHCQGIVKD
jgi:hypothetical protein